MSTYSPSLRIELITNGTQAGVWGTTTNDNLAYILDTSIAGYQTVSVISASQALTYTSGPTATPANNQSVYAMLRFTTTTGAAFSVYAPPASKMYIVWNNSGFAMTIYNSTVIGNTTAAGTGVTIANGSKVMVWSDGTSFYEIQASNLTGTLAIANGGTGQTTANAALNALLPAQTSNANKYLQTDGTNTSWDAISLSTSASASVTTGFVYIVAALGSTTLVQWQAFFGGLAAIPSVGQSITATATGTIVGGATVTFTDVTGTLPVVNGGTGKSSYSQYAVLYASTAYTLADNPSLLSFDGTNLGIGTNSPSTYGKLTVLGTGSFTNSLVSTSATASDKPTLEFRKTRNTAGGNENNAIGRFSFYSQNGTTTTESAYIDVTDTRISSLPFPKISLVCYNQTTGSNAASLVLGGTQTRLFSGSSSGIDYDATGGEHTFSGDVIFQDAVTATTFSGNATTATTATALSTASGSAPSYSARAWVNFDGTGTIGTNQTIRASGNIASVYKNGTGDYTINFSTAMQDANYAVTFGAQYGTGGQLVLVDVASASGAMAAGSVRIYTRASNYALADILIVTVTVFR